MDFEDSQHQRPTEESNMDANQQGGPNDFDVKQLFGTRVRLYKMLFKYPKALIGIIPSIFVGAVPIITFLFVGRIIKVISDFESSQIYDFNEIKNNALYLTIIAIITGICKFLDEFLWPKVGSEFTNNLKSSVFEKIMKSDISFFDQSSIGDMLTLLGQETEFVQATFGQTKGKELQYIGQFLLGIILSYFYCWKIALIATCTLPYFIILIIVFGMLMGQHYNLLYMYTGISITIADETLSSIRTVRGFNHEESECKRFMDATKMAVKEDQKSGFFLFCLNTLIDLSVWVVVIGNMYYGAQLVDKGEIISSDLISLFGFNFFGFMGIIMFQMLFQEEDRALISGMLLFAILDQEPSIPFDGGDIIENFKGHIEFKDVSFKYPSRDVYVLKNVSFEIKPGEMGALVGHSGSGKSTCIQLLERFYDATDGKILLDGKDIKTLDPHWLHQKISLVSQEPILFQLSVEDNIKYGKRDATKEMVIKAAKKSNALNFIEKLEGKFNYFVGEKGDSVSGGQRQRIAIARALIRDPVILLTDEATSALDAESEKKVQLALNKVMKNRTSVVVAHRLSTIQNANIIYVFDSGVIREKGTHSSLIKKKGYYYELVKMQMREEHRNMKK